MKTSYILTIVIVIVGVTGLLLVMRDNTTVTQKVDTTEQIKKNGESAKDVANSDNGPLRTYTVDTQKSVITWKGKAVGKEHTGTIAVKEGTFDVEGDRIMCGRIVIDMASMTNADLSGELREKLLTHLKSDDFFSVEKYPEAVFVMTGGEGERSDGTFEIMGNLTMKGITHPVTFVARMDAQKQEPVLIADLAIDRTLWDVKFGSEKFIEKAGVQIINDMIDVHMELIGR